MSESTRTHAADDAHWDRVARADAERAVLDPRDQSGRKNRFIHRLQAASLEEELGRGSKAELALDFGCGYGRLSPILARHAARVIGVDSCEPLVAAARRDPPANVEFRLCGGPRLPFGPATFDLCLIVGVLQFVVGGPASEAVIVSLVECLRPGARLILVEHVEVGWRRGSGYSINDYARLFEPRGFRLERTSIVRNGRDVVTYLVRFGLIPRQLMTVAARLETRLARTLPPMPWTHYRDVMLSFVKRSRGSAEGAGLEKAGPDR